MIRIAGFGHNGAASVESLADALCMAGGAGMLAALDGKSALITALGARLGLPVVIVPLAEAARQTCLTDSPASRAATGLASVAEAVALAARPGARLLAPRITSADGTATAAIALCDPESP